MFLGDNATPYAHYRPSGNKNGGVLKADRHFREGKAILQIFLCNGIDVGAFESFRAVYNSVKRAGKEHSTTSTPEKMCQQAYLCCNLRE
jgi:hypothetical protein